MGDEWREFRVSNDCLLDAEELRRHVRERLAGFKVPSVIELATAPLPRNASGKIMKRQIRDELAADRS